MRVALLPLPILVLSCGMFAVGCGGSGAPVGVAQSSSTGGDNSAGGDVGSSGGGNLGGARSGVGGSSVASSTQSSGGSPSAGGTFAGQTGVGGNPATGGTKASSGVGGAVTGGKSAVGGAAAGGSEAGGAATGGTKAGAGGAATGGFVFGFGGAATGGRPGGSGGAATGGKAATGGAATGGKAATGGATTVSTSTSPDPDCSATMPTSGGTVHTSSSQGGSNPLAWQVWSNGGNPGTVTTYSTPAFSTTWSNSSNYLGRLGFEWGNSGGTYDTHGTITAQFVEKRQGTPSSNNSWSYIGLYGWSTNPCVEWYIVEDSLATMPISPYNSSQKGTATIDGESYKFYSNNTNGTGGSRCSGVSSWLQFWSVRQKARQCGTITVTDHFDGWKAANMTMGNLLEVKILVEVGGGSGTIDFPVAKMTSTK